jgi:hypothetical protein
MIRALHMVGRRGHNTAIDILSACAAASRHSRS